MKTTAEKSSTTTSTHTSQQQPFFTGSSPAAKGADVTVSSEVVDLSSGVFNPSETVQAEINAQKGKGLDVRVKSKGLTNEGLIKIKADSHKKYDSVAKGYMPLQNNWLNKLGGAFICFSVRDGAITGGYATLQQKGGDANDWLQALRKNTELLGGLGLKIANPPSPVNKYESGKLTLGVTNLGVEVGGFVDAKFNLALENNADPKIDATAKINVKGITEGELKLDNTQGGLTGEIALGINLNAFSGNAKVKYLADGSIDISGKAGYNANKLSGEIQFVATDVDSANNFAKSSIAAAGGQSKIQDAPPPAPVPIPKPGKKQRGIAASGQLAFNLTQWFAGTVFVVVDAEGHVTVIGRIVPPAEIELFKQRNWDVELINFEAKAYYGLPVIGNLNLFAGISLSALASLGPAKIYAIEILGTYSTDPTIQKDIRISGSINISAYAGLRLRAQGGAGIEIASHDLKFGVGVNADIGVKAYADARPTIGYRDPGEFYVSGTLEMVAQPMLGLSGDFFIQLETPWWSPLSDHKWTWPLFSKEWPLTDPIGINAIVKEYVLGSGQAPEIELKKPEFDPSKFMTNMVDRTLPDKSGGAGAGKGSFKEDGSIQPPVVPPKKPAPKQPETKAGKRGKAPTKGKSAVPDPEGAKELANAKLLQKSAESLEQLQKKGELTREDIKRELKKVKIKGVEYVVQDQGKSMVVTPRMQGKPGKSITFNVKESGKPNKQDERDEQQKLSDLHKAMGEATELENIPHITEEEIKKGLPAIKKKHNMESLELVVDSQSELKETVHIVGRINPDEKTRAKEIDKLWKASKSSVPVYGSLEGGFGSSVDIASLTKDHPAGSGPSAGGGHWEALRQRMDGGSTYYVRGHLLNDNLGGSGGEWRNLAPLTQATNNRSAVSMLHTFESNVKTAVQSGDSVEFKVTMTYGRGKRSAAIADALEIEPASEGTKIAAIITAEQFVPKTVKCAAEKIGVGKSRTNIAKSTVENSIDTDLDHYATEAIPKTIVNINKASKEKLMTLNGVTATIANEVIKMRPIADRDKFIAVIGEAAWHKMVSTAGISIRFK
jgi:hypothetical protein